MESKFLCWNVNGGGERCIIGWPNRNVQCLQEVRIKVTDNKYLLNKTSLLWQGLKKGGGYVCKRRIENKKNISG